MSMLAQVKNSRQPDRARRVLLYGTHGIGKSTFGACAPKPVFLPFEDGTKDLSVQSFPLCNSVTDGLQAIQELGTEKHEFKTLVVDSMDWLEKIVWKQICEASGKDSLADFGFGKGYETAASQIRGFMSELDWLFRERNMWIVCLAHCKVEKYDNPMTESYDRYEPKLHKHVNGMVQEWADEVLFAGYKVFVKTSEEGYGKERNRGIGSADRVLFTTEKPSHIAKNRLSLPDELPLSFDAYHTAVKQCYERLDSEQPF